jgi:chemotaxis signal transduction protein
VTGVAKLKGRLVILLDLNKVIRRSELRRLDELAVPAEWETPVPALK